MKNRTQQMSRTELCLHISQVSTNPIANATDTYYFKVVQRYREHENGMATWMTTKRDEEGRTTLKTYC